MICLFHFPSLQPSVDTTFFASMQSFIHTTFEVASMHLHRRKVASMRLFQNCTGHSTSYTMGTYTGLCGEVRCLNNKFCRISPLSYTRRNMFVGRLGTGRFIVELKSVICRKMHIKFSLLCSCYEMSWSCHKHPKFFCLLARFELALTCPSASPSSLASLDENQQLHNL